MGVSHKDPLGLNARYEEIKAKIPERAFTPPDDLVNHPSHYTNGDIECIDAIKSALTPEEFRGYCKGSTLAYVWRERHKGGDQDIHKAEWFLKRLVQEGK